MRGTLHYLLYALMGTIAAIGQNAYGASPAGTIQFIASQEGVPLRGTFDEFAAIVNFDPAHPDKGTAQVRVVVGSVNTGTAAADRMLQGAEFFDVSKFPQATFEASEFQAQSAGHYIVKGTFTLKGHTTPLPVVFTTTIDAQGRWFDGSFTISRLSFGVGQGEWADTSTLDDRVQVQFHILQKRVSP